MHLYILLLCWVSRSLFILEFQLFFYGLTFDYLENKFVVCFSSSEVVAVREFLDLVAIIVIDSFIDVCINNHSTQLYQVNSGQRVI